MRIDVYRTVFSTLAAVLLSVAAPAPAQEAGGTGTAMKADSQAIRQLSESLVDAFNRKDADNLAALFLPDAELIDDAGNTHLGRNEIRDVFTKFIELFPDAKMDLTIDTVRLAAGELAIENGTRTVSTEGDAEKATNRYTMVHVKRDGKWQIAVRTIVANAVFARYATSFTVSVSRLRLGAKPLGSPRPAAFAMVVDRASAPNS